MALDPSIILQAGRGVVPLESPMDAMGKALALKSQFQQSQLQGLNLQQQTAAAQDAAAMRADIAAANGDPETLKAALLKRGKVKEAHEMATAEKQAAEAEAKRQKAHLEAVGSLNQQQLSVYQSGLDALVKDPTQAQAIHSFVLGKTAQNAKTLFPQMDISKTDDPPAFQDVEQQKAWLQNKISQSMNFDQRLKVADQALKEKELNNFGGFHPAIGPSGPGIFQATKAGEVRQIPGLKPMPNQTALMVGGGQLTPEAMAMLVQKYKDTGQLDADIGRNPALRAQIVNAAAKDGPVDLAKAKIQFGTAKQAQDYFTKGKGADAFRQQETILHHADIFTGIADALQNGNVQAANKLGNAVGVQFGSDQATNYKIAGQILSAEVGKYLAGGQSTAEERKELAELIPSFSSPQQMKRGLATLKALVEGQRQSWVVQRDAALQGKVPTYASDKGQASTSPGYKLGQVVKGYVFLGGDPTDQKNWKKQ